MSWVAAFWSLAATPAGEAQRCPGGAELEPRQAAGANSAAGCRLKRAEWGLHGRKSRANEEDEQYRLKVEEETTFVQSRSSS